MKLLNWVGTFLVAGILAIAQTITTKTLAVEASKDSITPSQKDGIELMQNVCGASNVFINRKQGSKVCCKTCPSFTGYGSGSSGGILTSVVYGSFTKAGIREALVDISDCEPHAANYGGSVLLRHFNRGWSVVRYERGLRSNICLKFPTQNGRNSLVCEGSHMGQGYEYNWLNAFEISSTKTTKTELLGVVSNTGSGNPPFYEMQISDWTSQDANKDGRDDLVVKVSEAREVKRATRLNGSPREPRLPKPSFHRLIFLFNGQSFRPTPETASLLSDFQIATGLLRVPLEDRILL